MAIDKNGNVISTAPPPTFTRGSLEKATNSRATSKSVVGEAEDPRVRIRPKSSAITEVLGLSTFKADAYKSGRKTGKQYDRQDLGNDNAKILRPLAETNGVVFPYTPTIQAGFSVEYGQFSPVHSNQDFQAYNRTPSPTFTISGDFTAQTQDEGLYSLAVIHFFRTITKMYFGNNGEKNGITPPTLLLSGYGDLMFNNLPILVTQYTIELVNNVDYVKVETGNYSLHPEPNAPPRNSKIEQMQIQIAQWKQNAAEAEARNGYPDDSAIKRIERRQAELNELLAAEQAAPIKTSGDGGIAWVPSKFLLTVSCVVNHTPKQMREFNLDSFRTGDLLKGKGGYKNNGAPNTNRDRGGWW